MRLYLRRLKRHLRHVRPHFRIAPYFIIVLLVLLGAEPALPQGPPDGEALLYQLLEALDLLFYIVARHVQAPPPRPGIISHIHVHHIHISKYHIHVSYPRPTRPSHVYPRSPRSLRSRKALTSGTASRILFSFSAVSKILATAV